MTEKQHRVTEQQIHKFKDALKIEEANVSEKSVINDAIIAGLKSILSDLEEKNPNGVNSQ